MEGYIDKVLLKYGFTKPMHLQLNPHTHQEIKYGATEQLNPKEDISPDLDAARLKRIPEIIGALLYYS